MVDGNIKNHRSVCYAINAGYAEYNGLPGIIRTGCPNTPAYKSRYYSLHNSTKERTSKVISKESHYASTEGNTSKVISTESAEPSGIVTGKRITRQGINYEVSILLSYF